MISRTLCATLNAIATRRQKLVKSIDLSTHHHYDTLFFGQKLKPNDS